VRGDGSSFAKIGEGAFARMLSYPSVRRLSISNPVSIAQKTRCDRIVAIVLDVDARTNSCSTRGTSGTRPSARVVSKVRGGLGLERASLSAASAVPIEVRSPAQHSRFELRLLVVATSARRDGTEKARGERIWTTRSAFAEPVRTWGYKDT